MTEVIFHLIGAQNGATLEGIVNDISPEGGEYFCNEE